MKTKSKFILYLTALALAVIYCGLWYITFGKNMVFPILTSIPLCLVIAGAIVQQKKAKEILDSLN